MFFPLGPRFVLQLIKVFNGSFGGDTLYENPKFVTPNAVSLQCWTSESHVINVHDVASATFESRS